MIRKSNEHVLGNLLLVILIFGPEFGELLVDLPPKLCPSVDLDEDLTLCEVRK